MFINTTKDTLEAIKEELRGLRLTTLQNRLDQLDQLIAVRGGVCVIVGTSCCTFMPDNNVNGHLIDEGLKYMTRIAQELQEREVKLIENGLLAPSLSLHVLVNLGEQEKDGDGEKNFLLFQNICFYYLEMYIWFLKTSPHRRSGFVQLKESASRRSEQCKVLFSSLVLY